MFVCGGELEGERGRGGCLCFHPMMPGMEVMEQLLLSSQSPTTSNSDVQYEHNYYLTELRCTYTFLLHCSAVYTTKTEKIG